MHVEYHPKVLLITVSRLHLSVQDIEADNGITGNSPLNYVDCVDYVSDQVSDYVSDYVSLTINSISTEGITGDTGKTLHTQITIIFLYWLWPQTSTSN